MKFVLRIFIFICLNHPFKKSSFYFPDSLHNMLINLCLPWICILLYSCIGKHTYTHIYTFNIPGEKAEFYFSRDCALIFKCHSVQRWQCAIHNSTLGTFDRSSSIEICVLKHIKTCLNSSKTRPYLNSKCWSDIACATWK